MRISPILIALCLPWATLSAQAPPTELLQAEIEELRSVVRNLDDSNRRLLRANDELTEEVVLLRRALAQLEETRTQATARTVAPEATPPATATPQDTARAVPAMGETGLEVIYVNPTWHYLILSGGTDRGMDNGQTGRILRAGNVVGTVRITSVKPSQCVADIDLDTLAQRGQYPRVGDIVVFP